VGRGGVPRTARLANARRRDDLSIRTTLRVDRTTASNHFSIELIPDAVANQQRRANCASAHVCRLTPAQARSEGTPPRPTVPASKQGFNIYAMEEHSDQALQFLGRVRQHALDVELELCRRRLRSPSLRERSAMLIQSLPAAMITIFHSPRIRSK
jgi:hypothetical protein